MNDIFSKASQWWDMQRDRTAVNAYFKNTCFNIEGYTGVDVTLPGFYSLTNYSNLENAIEGNHFRTYPNGRLHMLTVEGFLPRGREVNADGLELLYSRIMKGIGESPAGNFAVVYKDTELLRVIWLIYNSKEELDVCYQGSATVLESGGDFFDFF
tara:strand:+ start:39576 stop:40040 length:465 start_codon:yes stop_codon:yes gene_type:complete